MSAVRMQLSCGRMPDLERLALLHVEAAREADHATKWAIEGFVEAVAQKVAPFNIEFTIVDPGPPGRASAAAW
jgi:NAD(P)-dependent dehydrogenase (short-subunit alcohol dehydrogenase family)